ALATHLRRHPELRPLSRTEIAGRLRRLHPRVPPEIVIPLYRLLSLEDVISLTFSGGTTLYDGLRCLVPYLDEARRDELREVVRPLFEEVRGTIRRNHHPSAALLAARVGMHQELEDIIATWPNDCFAAGRGYSGSQVHNLIYGLGSADAVRQHMKRLG